MELVPGSISEVVARLSVWARRAPKGLAKVEYYSEYSRIEAIRRLRSQFSGSAMAVVELRLPTAQSPQEILNQIKRASVGDRIILSVSDWATAA
jgi:RNA recognition motif-containing protein